MPSPTKSVEEYKVVNDTLSPRIYADVAEKSRDLTDNFLMLYGTPEQYPHFRSLVGVAADGLLLWLVTEGYVTLNPEWVVTDEESAERELDRAGRAVERENASARFNAPGGYA